MASPEATKTREWNLKKKRVIEDEELINSDLRVNNRKRSSEEDDGKATKSIWLEEKNNRRPCNRWLADGYSPQRHNTQHESAKMRKERSFKAEKLWRGHMGGQRR
ncbi:hypothetical protein L2E82_06835 [Cichorium intybus]|uniref:Uncharacterized protein n=1 Tax=Cichorium intybus TaxID=13427 RepID=A0ACB9HCF2_CICIN|nr:hypothetical protein L2E82_06835 [Cichorium intybus]